jgi:hypothetical protein
MFGRKAFVLLPGLCLALMFASCASTGGSPASSPGSAKGGQPDWVRSPYEKYDRQANIAAVGDGNSRQDAENKALGNLVALFGQSIQVEEKIKTSYQQSIRNGTAASWSENTFVDSDILRLAGLDTLVGAEIGEVWDDGRGAVYAVAVMNKSKAAQIYSDMVRANQAMIDNLVNKIPDNEKNTINTYARYQFAATVADITGSYRGVLSVIGSPLPAQGVKTGNDYRIEAQNITRIIPIGISVQNDKSGRIQGAFAKALSDLGFISGGTNSRYVLTVKIVTSEADIANQPYKYTRIEVSADLTDTSNNTVLLPYNFNSREGHATQTEADNRAYMAAEKKIDNEYKGLLNNYLSQLLPKK